MVKPKARSLLETLDDLLAEFSMPEIIEALEDLCRRYEQQLKKQRNSEYQGWAIVKTALREARARIGDLE